MRTNLRLIKCMILLVLSIMVLPVKADDVVTQYTCTGNASYQVTSTLTGSSFNWTISPGTDGVDWSITGQGTSAITVNWITPNIAGGYTLSVVETGSVANGGCVGATQIIKVFVNPSPMVNQPGNQVLCNSATTSLISFTGTATSYNWSNNAPSIGLAASGTGSIGAFTATNSTNEPVIATITVYPLYTNGGTTCIGSAKTFTITVNPTPAAVATPNAQTICSGGTTGISLTSTTSGITYSWTVSAPGITGATAGSGNSIAQTLTNTTADPATATYTITPAANSCSGTPITVIITVNPTPVAVATPSSQTICSAGTTGIALTCATAGTTYSWTVSATGITGAVAGSGNNITQTLTNTTSNPATATYTITPSANGCNGTPITVIITVNPTPVAVATPSSQTICSAGTTGISLTSATTGATFNWTVSATGITGASAGSGNSIAQTLTNTTADPASATYTITPTANSCSGAPITVVITVNPTPVAIATPPSEEFCSGVSTNVSLTSPTPTTTFTWTVAINPPGAITGASASNGNTISQTLTNTITAPATATYTITPTANGCPGLPINVVETVNPIPGTSSIFLTQPSNKLEALTLQSGGSPVTINPTFSINTFAYTAAVPYSKSSVTVTPTSEESNALITVNGIMTGSGTASPPVSLNVGSNTITIVVTACNGSQQTYVVTVTRNGSAFLTSLTVNSGGTGVSLTPAFASATQSYSSSVGNEVSTVTIIPIAEESSATITVNGTTVMNGQQSGPISLNVGSNSINVVVTSQTAGTFSYTITITRSSSARLSNLVIRRGANSLAFNPPFSSNTLSYTSSTILSAVDVYPTKEDNSAIVTVNGTPCTTYVTLSMMTGSNTVNVVVTPATGGMIKTYTVTITR